MSVIVNFSLNGATGQYKETITLSIEEAGENLYEFMATALERMGEVKNSLWLMASMQVNIFGFEIYFYTTKKEYDKTTALTYNPKQTRTI